MHHFWLWCVQRWYEGFEAQMVTKHQKSLQQVGQSHTPPPLQHLDWLTHQLLRLYTPFCCLEIWHTERGIKMHLGANFGWNTINRQSFSPLVFSASGGMGSTATTVYKKLASMLADKWDMNYMISIDSAQSQLCNSIFRGQAFS